MHLLYYCFHATVRFSTFSITVLRKGSGSCIHPLEADQDRKLPDHFSGKLYWWSTMTGIYSRVCLQLCLFFTEKQTKEDFGYHSQLFGSFQWFCCLGTQANGALSHTTPGYLSPGCLGTARSPWTPARGTGGQTSPGINPDSLLCFWRDGNRNHIRHVTHMVSGLFSSKLL